MAITPLTAPYKTLTFDGETAASFGVQILGKGTFNAPKRDVEMIAIPGRSGELALDKGRFENIEVKYPARLIADSTGDFADAISAFRNFLCSRKGYCRLSDDYNPDEYRMAVYSRGLEADVEVLKAGKFDIVFDCKPQRWLTSGETAVSVDTGDVLTNPTQFESSPLLEVSGYGTIGFNDYEIELDNAVMGEVTVAEGTLISGTYTAKSWKTSPLRKDLFNVEDTVTWESSSAIVLISGGANVREITNVSVVKGGVLDITSSISRVDSKNYMVGIAVQDYVLSDTYDGAATTPNIIVHFVDTNGTSQVETNQFQIHLWLKKTYTNGGTCVFHAVPSSDYFTYLWSGINIGNVVADSTISILGNPTYIDCDIGEAYMVKDGSVISLNQYIDLGSDLPKLASGENEISFDNTITGLDITPRWWKV